MMTPVLLIIWSYLCQNHIASAICNYTQVETCVDRHFSLCLCVDCKICPPGEGLEPQCGSQVVMKAPKCVKCKPGETYSEKNSIESCNPCPICYGTETLQPCNSTHPTVCSKDCARGYKRSPVTETCEKDFTDDIWSKLNLTKHYGIVKNKESTRKTVEYIGRGNGKGLIGVYIACALAIAFGCAVACLLYKNWTYVKAKLRNNTRSSTTSSDAENCLISQAIIPDGLLLKDISTDLALSMSALISDNSNGAIKHWRHIGHEYGMCFDELNLIKQAYKSDSTNPGQQLLEKIHTIKPEETVNGFLRVLKRMKRNDVIKRIRDECSQRNDMTTSQDNRQFELRE